MDAISQLWGAPPGVLDKTTAEEEEISEQEVLINEGVDFRNIYLLWGGAAGPIGPESFDDEETTVSVPSTEGFAQLWNEGDEPVGDISDGENESPDDFQAYAGLPWWNEVSEDGKELRLSQILADEEYEETMEEKVEDPMTIERFAEETEKLIEQAEDERKETEAIMNAPPNADFVLEAVKDTPSVSSAVEKSIATSDKFEEMILSLVQSNEVDEEVAPTVLVPEIDLDALEMDVFPDTTESGTVRLAPNNTDHEDADDDQPANVTLPLSMPISEHDV